MRAKIKVCCYGLRGFDELNLPAEVSPERPFFPEAKPHLKPKGTPWFCLGAGLTRTGATSGLAVELNLIENDGGVGSEALGVLTTRSRKKYLRKQLSVFRELDVYSNE